MSGQWKEVARLAFKGERFRDHALDLDALSELAQFQKIVAETAKARWRAANPNRERLPKHFERRTRLCLRRIEEGSAVAPLEVLIEDSDQLDMYELEPTEIKEAIAVARHAFRALETDEPLPDDFPKHLAPEYTKFGQHLVEDESIEVITEQAEPASVTPLTRSRWAAFTETAHESLVDVTGEVLEADVRQGRFQVWLDEKTGVTVTFSPDQEELVTNALKDHRTCRLQVKGKGEFSPQGKLLRVREVEGLRLQPVGERLYDPHARPIEEILAELASEIPEEEWKRLPADLTDNLDHHLYGWPKR
jgi:hypothetical protein